jgi:hypothetical protein
MRFEPEQFPARRINERLHCPKGPAMTTTQTSQPLPQSLFDRFENEWRQIRESTAAPVKAAGSTR